MKCDRFEWKHTRIFHYGRYLSKADGWRASSSGNMRLRWRCAFSHPRHILNQVFKGLCCACTHTPLSPAGKPGSEVLSPSPSGWLWWDCPALQRDDSTHDKSSAVQHFGKLLTHSTGLYAIILLLYWKLLPFNISMSSLSSSAIHLGGELLMGCDAKHNKDLRTRPIYKFITVRQAHLIMCV